MTHPEYPIRIGFAGRWTRGTDLLASGFLEAWPEDNVPRILGVASIEDIPEFAGAVDGWILLHGDCIPWLEYLREHDTPVAARSVEYEPHGIPIAPTADETAGELAADCLSRVPGDLVYLGLPLTFSRRRWDGFVAGSVRAGRTPRALHARETNFSRLARDLPSGSGVFAYNDDTAHQMVAAVREAGRSVPGDIRVIGVDNGPLPTTGDPIPLTTVEFSLRRQGLEMGRLLRCQFENQSCPCRVDVQPNGLIHRASA